MKIPCENYGEDDNQGEKSGLLKEISIILQYSKCKNKEKPGSGGIFIHTISRCCRSYANLCHAILSN